MKQILIAILFLLPSGCSAQEKLSSVINGEEKQQTLSILEKNSAPDSVISSRLSLTNDIFKLYFFSLKNIDDFSFDKDIKSYLNLWSWEVWLMDKNDGEIFAESSHTKDKNYEDIFAITMEDDKKPINELLEIAKTYRLEHNYYFFRIDYLNEYFLNMNNKFFVVNGHSLVPLNDYLKKTYSLEQFKEMIKWRR